MHLGRCDPKHAQLIGHWVQTASFGSDDLAPEESSAFDSGRLLVWREASFVSLVRLLRIVLTSDIVAIHLLRLREILVRHHALASDESLVRLLTVLPAAMGRHEHAVIRSLLWHSTLRKGMHARPGSDIPLLEAHVRVSRVTSEDAKVLLVVALCQLHLVSLDDVFSGVYILLASHLYLMARGQARMLEGGRDLGVGELCSMLLQSWMGLIALGQFVVCPGQHVVV